MTTPAEIINATIQPASAARNFSSDTLGSLTKDNSDYKTTITKNSSAPSRSAVAMRFALQAKARELLPDRRVAWCLRRFRGGVRRVKIVHAKARSSAYYDGLMRCSRVWECPICASKISETRRAELAELLLAARVVVFSNDPNKPDNFYPNWFMTMLTFTIQHKPDEAAAVVLDRLDRAWKRYSSGRWIQHFHARYLVDGTLRGLELTHGDQGWHPHVHLLIFHSSQLQATRHPADKQFAPSLAEMLSSAQVRWSDVVAKIGGYADRMIGVALTVGDVAKYPIKGDGEDELKRWGMVSETTKQPSKRGREGNRSMTDLLIDACKGDELAGQWWVEGVRALDGHKQLQASMGLWEKLGRKPKTDEEAAEETIDPTDQVLSSLSWVEWRKVLIADLRGEILDIASTGNVEALIAYLESIGVYPDERS